MTATQNHQERPTPNNGHAGHDDRSRLTPARPAVPHSRAGGLWVAAVVFAVVLLLLLIFVLQNGRRVDVSFLGAHGHLPLGVALLLAAVFGVLLVALPGTVRIVQLRILGHRGNRHIATSPLTAPLPLPSDDPAGQQTRR
jgi:lipopolysaccharide assembly protein A